MPASLQDRVGRVRPPRVHITYDVETGGSLEKKEIPFVVGVLADLSGHRVETKLVGERKFFELNPDTFPALFRDAQPELTLRVPNVLQEPQGAEDKPGWKPATSLSGTLKFNSIDDFDPRRVAQQISPLKELLALRDTLEELKAKVQTNRNLDKHLQVLLRDRASSEQLGRELDARRTPDEAESRRLLDEVIANTEQRQRTAAGSDTASSQGEGQ